MNTTLNYHKNVRYLLNGFELPYPFSGAITVENVLTFEKENKVIFAYLADDQGPENPLEAYEGLGRIHRDSEEIYKVTGYDRYGSPDYDLVDEDLLLEHLMATPKEQLLELLGTEDEAEIKYQLTSTNSFSRRGFDIDPIQQKLWQEGRENGTIGNPNAVVLDVYEHSGISFSVSGEGTMCRFDTSRGGAIWVPDGTAELEILRLGEQYRKGSVVKLKTKYFVEVFGQSPETLPSFETWHEAYQCLENTEAYPEHMVSEPIAQKRAAEELARDACKVYTSYCNGDVYGVILATYDKETKELLEEDACWRYFGYDYALEELQSRVQLIR